MTSPITPSIELMNQSYPVPPPELVDQWDEEGTNMFRPEYQTHLCAKAAQWGADQELQACINFVYDNELCDPDFHNNLRDARRPKPPSLAKRALHILGTHGDLSCAEHDTIRRALEALDD